MANIPTEVPLTRDLGGWEDAVGAGRGCGGMGQRYV